MARKPKNNIPLTPEQLADQEFVAVTKKRSAQMAVIAVVVMIICAYKGVDLRIALVLVVAAFAIVNVLYILARKKKQASNKKA
jgi:cell division protein FtsW (lipid II flippase)